MFFSFAVIIYISDQYLLIYGWLRFPGNVNSSCKLLPVISPVNTAAVGYLSLSCRPSSQWLTRTAKNTPALECFDHF